MMGTTKRSLRMVTNSSWSMPSSLCARRKRSSESWMAFFWRSMSRRRRARATLALSATVPSGRILPSSSSSSARNSPMVAARTPRRRKRSAAAVRTDLASAARSRRAKRSKISLGSRLAPSMRSLWTAGSISGSPLKSTRMAAPPRAACGRAATRRYSMASPVSARSAMRRSRSWWGSTLSSSRRPSGLERKRPTSSRRASNSRVSAEVFTGLLLLSPFAGDPLLPFRALLERAFDYGQRAFGDLERGEVAAADPVDRAYVVTGEKLATRHAADVVDQHVVILGGAGRVAYDALEHLEEFDGFDD